VTLRDLSIANVTAFCNVQRRYTSGSVSRRRAERLNDAWRLLAMRNRREWTAGLLH